MRALELDVAGAGRWAALRSAGAVRRGGISNSLPANAALASVLVGVLAMSGWALAEGHLKPIVLCAAAAGVCALAFTQRGAFIAIFLLLAMNGVPEVDTSSHLVSHFTGQDFAIFVLILASAAWALLGANPDRPTSGGRVLISAGTLLLCWCLFTMGRTVVVENASILTVAAFARDYLYFAVLLILLPQMDLTHRDIGALLATLAVGVCLFAVGQIATALSIGYPKGLIHIHYASHLDGLIRVYSDMTDLVIAGLALSLAASLAAPQRNVRRAARPVALLLAVSVVVQLTRARWVGIIGGFAFVSAWLMLYGDRFTISAILRRRLVLVAGAVCLVAGVALVAAPGVFSSSPFITRVTTIFSDLESGGGTVAVRETVTRTMEHYLGGNWLEGLGFISPEVHYFAGLPSGSIQDPDLGVLNAIMPMGIIGAALIYLAPAMILSRCLRRSYGESQYAWLRYGGAIWIVAMLISSITLVSLFSTSGLALVAVLLTVLVHPSVAGTRMAMSPSEETLTHTATEATGFRAVARPG
jgi:hypothetical protein